MTPARTGYNGGVHGTINARPLLTSSGLLALALTAIVSSSDAQGLRRNDNPPKAPSQVERLGPSSLRVGNVHVDVAKKEVSVKGVVLEAGVLEFVAVTKDGFKAYESALELDTNAMNLNLGLILIGMDQARSVVPTRHFDPATPQGDPVEIFVEWESATGTKKVRVEELIYDLVNKTTMTEGPWVYTGSLLVKEKGALLADIDGPLIGFVHTPAPLIESPRSMGRYGNDVLNPKLGLMPGMAVTVIIRALPRTK